MNSLTKTLVFSLLLSTAWIFPQCQISDFRHIVIIYQENRSPDNLFQGLCGPARRLCPSPYNLQNFGIDSLGQTVPLTQVALGSPHDPDHSHSGFD
jgi:phospholipase C